MEVVVSPVTRTYTAQLVGVDPELLWSHHEATCRAKGIVSDVFTALRAGVGPELVDLDLGAVPLQRQLVATLWFPVEFTASDSGLSLESVEPGEMVERFRQELTECGLTGGEVDSWIVDAEPALAMASREDAVRVDRRGQLRRWCAEWGVSPREPLNDVVELTLGRSWAEIVSKVLVPAEKKASERATDEGGSAVDAIAELSSPSLNKSISDWVSNRFGTNATSNRAGKARAAQAIASVPVSESATASSELVAAMAAALGVDADLHAVLHQVHTGGENGRAGGARSGLYHRVADLGSRASTVDPAEIEKLVNTAKKEVRNQDSAATRATLPWSEALRDRIAAEVGLTFEGRKRGWCEIINGGGGRVVTNTSWTVRQLATRHVLAAECRRLDDALGSDLVQLLDDWCRTRAEETAAEGPVRVTARTIGSAKDVFAEFAACSDLDARREVLGSVQSRNDRDFGDPVFFAWLADDGAAVWRDVSPDGGVKRLQHYTKLVKARQQWENLRLPQLSHPDPVHAPHWSLFDCGTSNYQSYKLEKPTRKRAAIDETGFLVRLDLWDGAEWRETAARITSTYFVEQVLAQPDALARRGVTTSTTEGTPVPRADAVARRVSVRTEDVLRVTAKANAARPTLQLKFDRTRHRRGGHQGVPSKWSVALATKLEPTAPSEDGTPWRAHRKGHAPLGHRVLGVDLGLRTLAGWAVWQVVDGDEVNNVAASSGSTLTEEARYLTSRAQHETGPFADHRLVYRKLDGHQYDHWARLETTGLLDLADGRKRSGQGVEPEPQRACPKPTRRDWMLAARALKYAGARLNAPQQVTDDYRTSHLAFDYLHSLKRAVARHGQLAGLALAAEHEDEPDRLLRLVTSWWQAAAREPRSTLAQLWRSMILPQLPREPAGELVSWRGHRSKPPHQPRPGADDLRHYVDRLRADTGLREALAAQLHQSWAEDDERLRVPLRLVRVVVSGGVVPAKLAKTIGMPAASQKGRDNDKEFRHPGAVIGLNPRRLQLLDELYKLKRSWHMRRRPHRPTEGDLDVEQQPDGSYTAVRGPELLARLIEKRDRVRDQLSKQVASAIVETAAANGCHSIAYENLEAYRTSLHRSRDENKKLRLWAHQSITKHLEEIAALHGFGCQAVNPRGTSQHSAITDQRGVRVDKLSASQFGDQPPTWWSSAVNAARTRTRRGEDRRLDQHVLATEPFLEDLPEHGFVLIPRPGGAYFAAEWPPKHGIRLSENASVPLPNADVNAAANIGLRPLHGAKRQTRPGRAGTGRDQR